jgi:O-antigen ligase
MSTTRWLVPSYLVLCILFGGASAAGYLANAGLQLLAVALLVFAFLTPSDGASTRVQQTLLGLFAAALAIIAIQFLPLPTGLWHMFPGRAEILAPFTDIGVIFSHGFVSLIPHESLKSAVWLLPAAAVLLVMVRRPKTSGRWIAIALIGAMSVAVLVGAMQRATGGQSALYFYHFTNRGSAVGFFANANHMAILLLVTIPFQAALLREAVEQTGSTKIAPIIVIAASLAVTAVGVFVAGSLAGYGLLPPVAAASALIVVGSRKARLRAAVLCLIAVVAGMAFVLATTEGQALLDRGSGMSEGSRDVIFSRTWAAIRDFWPVGTGLGTFAEVYPSYEDPLTVTRTYINHAHNDYLELLLETGVAGLVVLVGFLSWWVVRAWRVWTLGASPFAKAAVIASATLLVHSSVEFPLRTAALSSIFAACLALMMTQSSRVRQDERESWTVGS